MLFLPEKQLWGVLQAVRQLWAVEYPPKVNWRNSFPVRFSVPVVTW